MVGVGVKWGECWKELIAWNRLVLFLVATWVGFDSDPWDKRQTGGWGLSQMGRMVGDSIAWNRLILFLVATWVGFESDP